MKWILECCANKRFLTFGVATPLSCEVQRDGVGGWLATMKPNRSRVLLLGLGDLGCRIAQLLVGRGTTLQLRLGGRAERTSEWAQLLSLGAPCVVTAAAGARQAAVALTAEFESFEPDLIVQCGSLLSPWAFHECASPPARQLLAAGFGLQVSSQLPIIRAVMQTCRKLGLNRPVLNCSLPDLTHCMLARAGLAPTAGIGNAAMIGLRVARAVGSRASRRIQVIAHHSQVARVMSGEAPTGKSLRPWVFVGGEPVLRDEILYAKPGLRPGPALNYLSAVTAVPVIEALVDADSELETNLPGVNGLPGGYPITLRAGKLAVDLPAGIDLASAVQFNESAARADGVDHIGADGTVHYTREARQRMAPWCPELAEPLHPNDADKRFELLRAFLSDCQHGQRRALA